MTEVTFYFNTQNIFDTICKICIKALSKNLNTFIQTNNIEEANKISQKLWLFKSNHVFLPNTKADDENLSLSPIIIGNDLNDHIKKKEILINLNPEVPFFFSQYNKFIEVIDHNQNKKKIGRKHYSFFSNRGYKIQTYDLT